MAKKSSKKKDKKQKELKKEKKKSKEKVKEADKVDLKPSSSAVDDEGKEEITIPVPAANNDDGDNDSESDSEDLFDAAAQWAQMKEDEDDEDHDHDDTSGTNSKIGKKRRNETSKKEKQQTTLQQSSSFNPSAPYNPASISPVRERKTQRASYSLHITNLPYDATQLSIHKAFTAKGCKVMSTRPVFSYHVSRKDKELKSKGQAQGPKNGFTGVAFIDVADEESYKKALDMDKMVWVKDGEKGEEEDSKKGRGWRRRRINVRPTRTKEELADIVSRTKEKLEKQKEAKKEDRRNSRSSESANDIPARKRYKKDDGTGKSTKRQLGKDDEKDENKPKRHKPKGKLTKKERARKAAILQSKRGKNK